MTELLRSREFAAGFVERQNLLLDGEAPGLRAEPAFSLPATAVHDLATLLMNSPGQESAPQQGDSGGAWI
ncbi:MAG: hypothetical protein H6836_04500 [Planctomycetes bacterium]|nr:hypothetical protein [Planctomycetota bacterium]